MGFTVVPTSLVQSNVPVVTDLARIPAVIRETVEESWEYLSAPSTADDMGLTLSFEGSEPADVEKRAAMAVKDGEDVTPQVARARFEKHAKAYAANRKRLGVGEDLFFRVSPVRANKGTGTLTYRIVTAENERKRAAESKAIREAAAKAKAAEKPAKK